MATERNLANTVDECRYPGLPCDRICMECRGSFDIVDRETGRRVGDVSDTVAMRLVTPHSRMTEFAFPLSLACRKTANGGREWFFALDEWPMYPGAAKVGVFTNLDVTRGEALKLVLRQWLEARP